MTVGGKNKNPMIKNKLLRNMNNLVQSLSADPLTFKKAVLLCCYAEGMKFAAEILFFLLKFNYGGLLPSIVYLVTVLIIAREMGKGEIRRIFVWRDIPLAVFAGVLVMFFGLEIVKSELNNLFYILLPVPTSFFDGWFYMPQNTFVLLVSMALFPAFTEEIFFRGIVTRRFCKTYTLRKAIVLNAVLFGVIHLNPWQAVNAFFLGIFLGWIYWRYKSIWLCMFIHAYHNALALLMPLPYVGMQNEYYEITWRHPLWFDILGVFLLGFGLLTVIVLSRKKESEQ
jgi:membrane protease YdiL (CAAX protease family)